MDTQPRASGFDRYVAPVCLVLSIAFLVQAVYHREWGWAALFVLTAVFGAIPCTLRGIRSWRNHDSR